MSDLALILKNTLALNVASAVTNLLSFCTTLLIARHYGEALFGQYMFALYFAGLFLVVMEVGIDQILIRDVTRDKTSTSRYLVHALLLRIGFACIALALIAGLSWHLPRATLLLKQAVVLAGFYMAFQSLGNVFIACFRAYERMGWVSLLAILLKTLTLLGVGTTIVLGGGLRGVLASYVLAAMAVVGLGSVLLHRQGIKLTAPWEWSVGKYLVLESLPIAASFVCASINGQLDVVLLRHFRDDASVGCYGAALMFVTALLFISANFASALYPRFAQLAMTSRAQLAQYYERSLVYLAVLGLPMAAVLTSWANPLMLRLYGESYRAAVPALQLLAWALALQTMNAAYNVLMMALNRQRLALAFHIAGTIVTVVLALVWIPRWGEFGAASARVVAWSFSCVAFYAVSARLLYRVPLLRNVGKPALTAIVIGLLAWGLRNLTWWVSVPVLGVAYLGLVTWLKIFQWKRILASLLPGLGWS